jgi:hypothetical protein
VSEVSLVSQVSDAKFVKLVQEGRIKQPTQRGFSLSSWEEAYTLHGRTLEDERLYKAGVWHFSKLELCREHLSRSSVEKTGYGMCRAVAGHLNRTFFILDQRVRGAPLKNSQGSEYQGLGLNIHSKERISIEEMLESSVTSSRYPLAAALRHEKEGEVKGLAGGLNELEDFQKVAYLASYYSGLEVMWQLCLWHGRYIIDSRDDFDVVAPAQIEIELAWAVGLQRRSTGDFQRGLMVNRTFRKLLNRESPMVKRARKIKFYNRGRAKLHPIAFEEFMRSEERLNWGASVERAYKEFPDEILDHPLPVLEGLTPEHLLQCWEVLVSFSVALKESFGEDRGAQEVADFFKYARPVRTTVLKAAIEDCTGLTQEQAVAALHIFTNKGCVRTDPWYTPLVPIGEGQVALLTPVVETTEVRRLLEWWLREGGVDLSERGRVFERQARHELQQLIEESPLEFRQVVTKPPRSLSTRDSEEEIDLLWRFGQILFVVEIKCIVQSVEPLERYNALTALRGGAVQAVRKAKFVRDNPQVLDTLPELGFGSSAEPTLVYPLVLSNLEPYAGYALAKNVPFVDLRSIRSYVVSGGFYNRVEIDHGNIVSGNTVKFYENEIEAQVFIVDHFLKPADTLSRIKDCEPLLKPMAVVDESEKPWARMEVEPSVSFLDHGLSERHADT